MLLEFEFIQAYASMLYLKKFNDFRIILRGKPVQHFNIADELRHAKRASYKPQLGVGNKEVTSFTVYNHFCTEDYAELV